MFRWDFVEHFVARQLFIRHCMKSQGNSNDFFLWQKGVANNEKDDQQNVWQFDVAICSATSFATLFVIICLCEAGSIIPPPLQIMAGPHYNSLVIEIVGG